MALFASCTMIGRHVEEYRTVCVAGVYLPVPEPPGFKFRGVNPIFLPGTCLTVWSRMGFGTATATVDDCPPEFCKYTLLRFLPEINATGYPWREWNPYSAVGGNFDALSHGYRAHCWRSKRKFKFVSIATKHRVFRVCVIHLIPASALLTVYVSGGRVRDIAECCIG